MNQDKGGDWWLSKDRSEINVPVMLAKEFLGGLTRAWCTGLLLNLTQVNTISQAAQLGFFLYFAVLVPTVVSDNIWEKRSMQLLKFKLMASLSNIVVMACIMHLVGTR
ncbi:hypothetical protein BGW38_006058 [Lunasporangiospora selenospora]|uniref:Uncharacterized protein n=1 Tax=Lunasporangiospora selenospora TaxID=979761 RepID=A0A9P6FZA6_9FUNG|nr:hypothetical protein BGW38_006058 [Lunasporangiospora selenospora]